MWLFPPSLRFLPRYLRLGRVLGKHFLGEVGRSLRRRRRPAPPRPSPLVRALGELGPAYILLGRFLRWREDLLPEEVCRDLARLPEGGSPMPWEEVRRVVEEELGRPLEVCFSEFSPRPWRCTWLEQVHSARRPDGREVWVCVPNPAVRLHLERERAFLRQVVRRLERVGPAGGVGPAGRALALWEEALRQKQDARERARSAHRWQELGEAVGVLFPAVEEECLGPHLLTCVARPAGPLGEWAATCPGGPETPLRLLYRFYGQAIFEHGFYPALPEAGDLLVQRDGRPVCLALAPVGRLDGATRRSLLHLLESFSRGEEGEVLEEAAALGLVEGGRPAGPVRQAVRHLLDRYPDMAPDEVRWEEVARDLLALSGRGILSLSEEMLLLLLTLRNLEEIGRGLAPQVSLTGEMAEPFQAALAAQGSWAARGERLLQAGRSWLEALADFPEEASRFLRVLGEGDWQVGVEMRNWQRPMRRLERMANRLVLSILMAGLTLALALLLTALLPAGSPWGWVVAGLALSGLLLLVALLLASFLRGMG